MSLSNLLDPNDYQLFCESLTASQFLKTVEIDTPDPEFLLIGSNQFTTQGVAFGMTGSSQTYMFNGIPYNPASGAGVTGPAGPTGPSNGITGATGAAGATGSPGFSSIGTAVNATDNNVLTIAGTVLNAQYATTSRPGVLSSAAQAISGAKTFDSALTALRLVSTTDLTANYIALPTTSSATIGCIQKNAVPFIHGYGNDNLCVGVNSGNFTNTAVSNACYGSLTGNALTTGNLNVLVGQSAGLGVTTGIGNVLIGANAGDAVTTGGNCIAIGTNVLAANTTSSNIIEISDGTVGNSVAGDIRIGYSASTACFVRGIASVAPGGTPQMVIINPATHKLGSQSIDNITTTNFTATLDSGSILSSNVRGSSSAVLPITLTKVGSAVTMVIPAFQVLTQSGAAASIFYTGVSVIAAAFRPTYALSFPVTVVNNATYVLAIVYVTTGGLVSMQLSTGANFTLTTGSNYDMSLCWNIAP